MYVHVRTGTVLDTDWKKWGVFCAHMYAIATYYK